MRPAPIILSSAFLLTACGGDDSEPYPTYKECFDDHHNVESLPVDQAITVCCIEHDIGGAGKNVVCGADSAACTTYVTAQLGTEATAAEIMTGCTTYQSQH